MLKRDITYTDFFSEEQVTETFYFNLTEAEVIELEVDYPNGLQAALKAIVAAEDNKQLVAEFKKIILWAFGEKQGNQFVKTEEAKTRFASSPAYSALFIELASNADAAAVFVNGITPKGRPADQDKPSGPPPAPATGVIPGAASAGPRPGEGFSPPPPPA